MRRREWDPAIYRAKQVIIAGDEMQLPPANLFRGSLSDNEEEEPEFDVDESQSLLNLAKRRFPEKILQWHYRSKSEELINFSNHAFYHGQVQIAPNVQPLKQPAAIQWKKVDGLWAHQQNEIEAHEVVELLKQQLVINPNQTVGIITFNAKQQDKILDLIDKKIQEDPEFEAMYHQVMSRDLDERIFVKNIENVQGDERDVIIFSIGYAKNHEGKVYNRFGTLNQHGGENRLNVAVSRAKEKIHVVSSIEPHELNVANAKNQGPRLLKAYLEYAKAVSNVEHEQVNHVLKQVNEQSNIQKQEGQLHFDSTFEEEVYQQLRAIGYEVNTQLGLSGYRIDLAIIHPNDPQKYILGIECDGAMYHSSKNAKERDVYRQKFLESRGWKITRIWSRNWWRNPTTETERIDQMVRSMVQQEQSKQKVESM
ncbi:AAA domain-containing protein [Caldalkalibacillus mannanilyticus]|uniref:AAA domain-containing protein n=1 Tax=Caldalkalibacillus mannanilyticus TaxID=1418 RepID=UPI000A8E67B1|nr:AAA domain-containing protein [Caldalkalibacillus mannanilyticus]